MVNRETPCRSAPVPASMRAALAGYDWARDLVGESGGAVYRLHGKPGAPDLYLKHGRGAVAADIGEEALRLRWLGRHVAAAQVLQFVRTLDEAWLLTTALPGRTAWQVLDAQPDARPALVDALAAFLRRLHAVPVQGCPFDSDHAGRLVKARARIDAGLVAQDDFDEEREGWTAEQVWEALQARLPLAPDPVVTHGDYSLDNLLVVDGQVAGCIDAGRVGVADRYQDLAIAWNCLGEFGPRLQARFLESYGIAAPDKNKLDFHLLLDELF